MKPQTTNVTIKSYTSICNAIILLMAMALEIFAQTAANTQIKNIASVSFSDGTTTYNSQSNEVIVTVAQVSGLTITPDGQVDAAMTAGQTGVTKTLRVTNIGNFTDSVRFLALGKSLRVVGPATITAAVAGTTDIFGNNADVDVSLAQNGYVDVTVTLDISPTASALTPQSVQVILGDATTGTNFDNVTATNSLNEVKTVATTSNNGQREARGDISFPVVSGTISGRVFEDVNYGGGAGRSLATSSGVVRSGAIVELYKSDGTFLSSTTTNLSGDYSFAGRPSGNYIVRVVNSSVTSSRSGYVSTLEAVQTFRTDAQSGTAVANLNKVGGELPSKIDAAANTSSATLGSLTTATTTAESVTAVTLGSIGVSNIDFGYNFDTIVNTNDKGQGSFRQFIENANALANAGINQVANAVFDPAAGEETSIFMIPTSSDALGRPADSNCAGAVCQITPLVGSLPSITQSATVDGRTQPSFSGTPVIKIDGQGYPTGTGLSTSATSDVKIRGFVISYFQNRGIDIANTSNVEIAYNYVGTDPTGTVAQPNFGAGIGTSGISSNLDIHNNLISGNDQSASGIVLYGTNTAHIRGNMIGTNVDATSVLSNDGNGITLGQSSNITIGGASSADRNIISGNKQNGIGYESGTTLNNITILGNYIGVGGGGQNNFPNNQDGISLGDGSSLVSNITIGGLGAGMENVISGNAGNGIKLSGVTTANILGNKIGVAQDGTTKVGNGSSGVNILGASSDIIIEGDIISGNESHGVIADHVTNLTIKGDYIGVGSDNSQIANHGDGIQVNNSTNLNIGGIGTALRNVIAGNTSDGIRFSNDNQINIISTFVGIVADGVTALGNENNGVEIASSTNITIGGTTPGEVVKSRRTQNSRSSYFFSLIYSAGFFL